LGEKDEEREGALNSPYYRYTHPSIAARPQMQTIREGSDIPREKGDINYQDLQDFKNTILFPSHSLL